MAIEGTTYYNISGGDGDDSIISIGGNNILTGGDGNDSFTLSKNSNSTDIITDYKQGEKINLKYIWDIVSLDQAKITQEGNDTVIELFDNQTIVLKDFNKEDLRAEDFIFDNFDSANKAVITKNSYGGSGNDVVYADNSFESSSVNILDYGKYLGHSNNTQRMNVADFNGDGKADLLNVGDGNTAYNNLYLSNGNGFNRAINLNMTDPGKYLGHSNNTQRLKIADFDGDGMADLLNVGNGHGSSGAYYNNLYLSNGGGFDRAISINILDHGKYLGHSNNTQRLHVADFNGDGKADLLNVGDGHGSSGSYYNNLYLSNGNGFDRATSINILDHGKYLGHSNNTQRLHIGDFNGDGMADLLNVGNGHGSSGGYYNNLYLANGNGFNRAISINILDSGRYLGHSNNTQRLHVADFNGDGMDDLLNVGDGHGSSGAYYNNLYLSNGNGFDRAISINILDHGKYLGHSNNSQRLQIADFNGDGMADILNVGNGHGSSGSYYNNLYLSNGNGFDRAISINVLAHGKYLGHSNNTQRLHVADFDGGGMADLLNVGNGHGTSGSYYNNLYLSNRGKSQEYHGGAGNDTIYGQDGDDKLYGDSGNDTLLGGIGNDEIHGGSGIDNLIGEEGYDLMFGDDGDDILLGGEGNDDLHGGNGNDTLRGDSGYDLIQGGAGNDTLEGGSGNDVLKGDDGNDTLKGEEGNDNISGGLGIDILAGGVGEDSFDFSSLEDSSINASDYVEDFEQGLDKINLSEIEEDLSFESFEFVVENGHTVIKDQDSDFAITLQGQFNINEDDFVF